MRAFAALAVLAVALSGCFAATDGTAPAGAAGWSLECSLSNWEDPCTVRASPNESPSKAEIDIAVNPLDALNAFVASKDLDPLASDCVWSVGQVTKDGGRSWRTVYVGGTAEERADPLHPLFGWACVSDPNVAFDLDGTLYYVMQLCCEVARPAVEIPAGPAEGASLASRALSALVLAVSRDGGETFPLDEMQVLQTFTGHGLYHDFPRMAVSPATGTLVVAVHAKSEQIVAPLLHTFRAQAGERASGPTLVEERAERAVAPNPALSLAADADGTFYLVVHSISAFAPEPTDDVVRGAYLYASRDDGRTFALVSAEPFIRPVPAVITNTGAFISTIVDLAADPATAGRLFVTWMDGANGGAEVLFARSDDAGATWTQPAPVKADGTGRSQWLPRARVAADGSVHVAFLDRALDPDDHLFGATHAVSTDGGATWTTTALATVLSDPDVGLHQDDRPFVGDYIGLAIQGMDAWVGFPLEHDGRLEIAVAHLAKGEATS